MYKGLSKHYNGKRNSQRTSNHWHLRERPTKEQIRDAKRYRHGAIWSNPTFVPKTDIKTDNRTGRRVLPDLTQTDFV